jgi:hypothetical protein
MSIYSNLHLDYGRSIMEYFMYVQIDVVRGVVRLRPVPRRPRHSHSGQIRSPGPGLPHPGRDAMGRHGTRTSEQTIRQ